MLHGTARSISLRLLAVLTAASIVASAASLADDDDHEKAPANAASLDDALAAVRRIHPGRILKVKLDSEDDGPAAWVYEVKVLTADGYVLEVTLDAVSLQVVDVEGDGRRHSDD